MTKAFLEELKVVESLNPVEDLTVEELYDLADETEDSIKNTEELQQWLLMYHELICKQIIQKEQYGKN